MVLCDRKTSLVACKCTSKKNGTALKVRLFSIHIALQLLHLLKQKNAEYLKTCSFNFKVDSTSKIFSSLVLLLYIFCRVAEVF